jgi:hypothetical protein
LFFIPKPLTIRFALLPTPRLRVGHARLAAQKSCRKSKFHDELFCRMRLGAKWLGGRKRLAVNFGEHA